jgi:hypothetical protein
MYATGPAVARIGRTGGRGLRPGLALPLAVPASRLTRPTLAAIPVPAGEDVYAAKFRNAPALQAEHEAARAAQTAVVSGYEAQDAAVIQAKLKATAHLNARGAIMAVALDAAAVPKSDARVAFEKQAAAARATAGERVRIQAAVRARGGVPVVDEVTGSVRLLDAASDPSVAAAHRRKQASSYRPPYNAPSYVVAALAASPEDEAAAAAVGTGKPNPQAVVQAQTQGDEAVARGLGFGDAAPAPSVAPALSGGALALLALGAFLLLRR